MRVLVACEESQTVCYQFRIRGHTAFSCDIQECSGGHPEWHIKDDVLKHLDEDWDLIIAHPPCTYLSKVGSPILFPKPGIINQERYEKGLKARDFFMTIYNANCPKICIENPIPNHIYNLPKPTQAIEPHQFGEPYSKKTLLWLKNLPPLLPRTYLYEYESWTAKVSGSKKRSKTFSGIAIAMAETWG